MTAFAPTDPRDVQPPVPFADRSTSYPDSPATSCHATSIADGETAVAETPPGAGGVGAAGVVTLLSAAEGAESPFRLVAITR